MKLRQILGLRVTLFLFHFLFLTLQVDLGRVPQAEAVTLVHSNDVFGEIEPCGCRTNPQGGMARKFNLLKTLTDPFILQLDAGDLLFGSSDLPDILQEQAELQAGYLLRSMELVHHDAVVPGEKDFALGLKVFEKLRKKTKIRFLAANLVQKNGKPFLPPHAIFSGPSSPQVSTQIPGQIPGQVPGQVSGQLRVAVFGLVGTQLKWPRELRTLSMLDTARKEVKSLRGKADWIIALTHQGLEQDKILAEKVPGIDVIVGAHSQSFLQEPIQIGSTWIVQSSFKNQYVGVLPLEKAHQLGKYQLVGLDPAYDSPGSPGLSALSGQAIPPVQSTSPTPMDQLVQEFKRALGEFNVKKEALLKSVARTDRDLSGSGEKVQKFQTFSRCAECHLKQFDFWRQTSHAKALNSLVQKNQERNKECLSCHTVGLGDSAGFNQVSSLAEFTQFQSQSQSLPQIKNEMSLPSESLTEVRVETLSTSDLNDFLNLMASGKSLASPVRLGPSDSEPRPIKEALHSLVRSWAPVQCENCHQPGREHPFAGEYSRKVEKSVCLSCHTLDRAPNWYTQAGQPNGDLIEKKFHLMTCPAGEMDPS